MRKTSLADLVTDWETLLKNVADTSAELPNIEIYRSPLEQLLTQAKDGIALSQARIAIKQNETKDRQRLMRQGQEAAAKLRAAIKAHYGPRSERLLQFGMKPPRGRKKSAKATIEKPKPEEPASASHPESTPKAS